MVRQGKMNEEKDEARGFAIRKIRWVRRLFLPRGCTRSKISREG